MLIDITLILHTNKYPNCLKANHYTSKHQNHGRKIQHMEQILVPKRMSVLDQYHILADTPRSDIGTENEKCGSVPTLPSMPEACLFV